MSIYDPKTWKRIYFDVEENGEYSSLYFEYSLEDLYQAIKDRMIEEMFNDVSLIATDCKNIIDPED